MKSAKLFFSLCTILLSFLSTYAQVKVEKKDTVQSKVVQPKSDVDKKVEDATIYKKIEKFSEKSKFTQLLHKAIFESTNTKNSNPIRKPKKRSYKKFEGKIIRNINIVTLDPFGFSVTDTARKPNNWAEKVGNKLHLKSKEFAIRNLTLLKKNTPLDSLLVRETERLIRNQRFVSQVYITAEAISKNSDSVDVTVRTLDSWSIIPQGSISSNSTSFELVDRNFIGSGIEFSNRIVNDKALGRTAYATRLMVPTIKNTFINTTINYHLELDQSYGKSINVERRFFSAFTKWAGGIYIDQQFKMDSIPNSLGVNALQNFKYNSQDVWGGRSFLAFKGSEETDRTTNFIFSSRFLHTGYTETPSFEYDPINFYAGENFYLSSFGISSRQFVEDQYLFNYGIIEDVPIGKIYSITGGYQDKNQLGRYYLGARAAFGNYFKYGYLSANFEYGTFFKDKKPEQSALTLQANYFTNLISLGEKWKMRQFVKPQLVLGWNRLNSDGDKITINENSSFQGNYGAGVNTNNAYGIRGYNTEIYGTQKVVLSLQTQFYSPWDLWGFRFSPYFNATTALMGNEDTSLLKSPLYTSLVVGLIISNDFLVFNSFQFSLAYFPSIPNQGTNVFSTNSFQTSDFGFQDFELGKPRTVIYQ